MWDRLRMQAQPAGIDHAAGKAMRIAHLNTAEVMADRKTFGHLSYWDATRRQSFSLPNIISIRLRRLWRRLSYLAAFFLCFRTEMQGRSP